MNEKLDLGKIAYLIGKKLRPGDPYYAGYVAAKKEAQAERKAHAIKMARYDQLKAEGLSDSEIEARMNLEVQ